MMNLDGNSVYIFGGANRKWRYLDWSQNPPMFIDVPGKMMETARTGMAVTKVSGYYFPQCMKRLLLW